MPDVHAHEFHSNERVTIVAESGIHAGPSFILLHGIGMGRRYWGELSDTLGHYGRVYALDLPGFGDAPEPAVPMEMHQLGDLVAELVKRERIERPVLIGHSMGTQVATETAARHPELFSHLVLISPTVNASERTARVQALRLVQDLWGASMRVFWYGTVYYAKAGPRWYFATLKKMMKHRVEESYRRVGARTIVIRGTEDRVCPRDWVDRVVTTIPNARLVEVAGTGHEVMMTHGKAIADLIVTAVGAKR